MRFIVLIEYGCNLMKYREENRDLVYWLFFEIYDYSENVSRQTINKKFCLHFTDKTDSDIDESLDFLINANVITMVDKEKETIRITPNGGQVIQKLFKQFILDKTDLEFFSRYNNGIEANYLKYYRDDKSEEQDLTTKKLRVALTNIKEFLTYFDSIRSFSPHIRDLYELIGGFFK